MSTAGVVRSLVLSFQANDFRNLELRGKLTDRDAVCRSCGKPFRESDLLDSRYKNGRNYNNMVKRHLVCAIFHHVTTEKEAQKQLGKSACLVPGLVEYQLKKLAEERRRMFSLQVRSVAMAVGFIIFGVIYNLNA